MKSFQIGKRVIGPEYPPFIIAEIGINHGGKLSVAKEMVDAAKKAGAEIVKHQTHVIDDEMSCLAKKVIPGNSDKSIYTIMSEAALSESEEFELKEYVEKQGMIFLSTPFSRAAAERLNKFGVLAFKIGSGECNNYPLIKHIACFGKPMIVSTGMNDINSVRKTVEIIESYNIPYALLHTTNLYPTPPELVRLGAILDLKANFPNAIIGLSDHTINNNACLGAVALGASIIERHFTDSLDREGPDIVCSMTPDDMHELIIAANEIYRMRGGHKQAVKEEQVTMNFAFATIVSIKPIKKGELFTKENLWVKRPGIGGIMAEHYERIINKRASRDISIDEHIKWADVTN